MSKNYCHAELSFCHAERDFASYQLGVLHGSQQHQILKRVQDDVSAIALTLLAKAAFTMAEILLSLTIIGVVAAITLPSLTGNINERTWNTQRKALYSRLSQAIALMPSVRGYGTMVDTMAESRASDQYWFRYNYSSDDATMAFLTNGLGKVLKMNNICDYDKLSDCGLPEQINRLGGGEKISLASLNTLQGLFSGFANHATNCDTGVETKAAAFETANGESVLVHYKPICVDRFTGRQAFSVNAGVCANFIYDLNGKKGPNTIGKDMGFMTLFYPSDSILVAPMPLAKNLSGSYSRDAAARACNNLDDAKLPNIDELASIALNEKFVSSPTLGETYSEMWSSTKSDNDFSKSITVYFHIGSYLMSERNSSESYPVRCVKR